MPSQRTTALLFALGLSSQIYALPQAGQGRPVGYGAPNVGDVATNYHTTWVTDWTTVYVTEGQAVPASAETSQYVAPAQPATSAAAQSVSSQPAAVIPQAAAPATSQPPVHAYVPSAAVTSVAPAQPTTSAAKTTVPKSYGNSGSDSDSNPSAEAAALSSRLASASVTCLNTASAPAIGLSTLAPGAPAPNTGYTFNIENTFKGQDIVVLVWAGQIGLSKRSTYDYKSSFVKAEEPLLALPIMNGKSRSIYFDGTQTSHGAFAVLADDTTWTYGMIADVWVEYGIVAKGSAMADFTTFDVTKKTITGAHNSASVTGYNSTGVACISDMNACSFDAAGAISPCGPYISSSDNAFDGGCRFDTNEWTGHADVVFGPA